MGKCVEKEEIDAPADFFQPKASQTSPYLTTPVSFLIGPQTARYTVPRAFLSESPQWSKSEDYYSSRIALPEVNEDVGHTLVHYLYTGTFQTLQSPEDDDDLTAELKKNVHLYGVANKYGLAGLKGLALEKIQNQEGLGDIFDILETIKEASKTLLKDDLGLKPYIKRELEVAFESDNALFGKERFIELFGEAKQFDRILMRIVADIYSEKIAQISQNTPAVSNGSPVEAIFITGTSSPCPPFLEEPPSVEPVGYGKLYGYENPSECEDPVTFEDLVDKFDLSEGYPVQKRFSTLAKEPYNDLAVNKVDLSKKYTKYAFLERIPTLEKETSGKSEEPIPESNPWDHPLRPDQDLSGGFLPVYRQAPSEDDFLPGVSEELEELKDLGLYAKHTLGGRNFSTLSASCRDSVPYDEPASPVERSFGGNFTSCEVVGSVYQPIIWGEAVSRAEAVTLEQVALCPEDTPAEAVPSEEEAAPPAEAPVELDLRRRKGKKGKKSRRMNMTDDEMEEAPCVEPAPCAEVAPCEEPAPCAEVAPCAEPAPWIELAPCTEVTQKPEGQEAAPVEWGFSAKKLKKGKKSKKVIMTDDPEMEATPFVEEPAPCAEVVPCAEAPCAEPAICTEVAPSTEAAPCTEVVRCIEVAPSAEAAPCTEVVPCIEAPPQEDIPTKKKLKKKASWAIKKNTKSPRAKNSLECPDPVPGPSTSGGRVHAVPASIAEEPRTGYGVDLSQQHPDESSICASRATHLLVDDEWKKCPKCRALIHHLSLELARNLNEDKHVYEII